MSKQDELIETMMSRISDLEAKQKSRPKIEDSVWLVYNPNDIRVWCPKVDCPHLGRESKVSKVMQPVTEEEKEGLDEEVLSAINDKGEIEVPVVHVSAPKKSTHPLGVVRAFASEREATNYIRDFYRKNRYDPSMQGIELSVCEVEI